MLLHKCTPCLFTKAFTIGWDKPGRKWKHGPLLLSQQLCSRTIEMAWAVRGVLVSSLRELVESRQRWLFSKRGSASWWRGKERQRSWNTSYKRLTLGWLVSILWDTWPHCCGQQSSPGTSAGQTTYTLSANSTFNSTFAACLSHTACLK